MPKKPPIILGHEVAGVVVEAGPDAAGYIVDDRVVASGTQQYCPGRDADGGYATYGQKSVAEARRAWQRFARLIRAAVLPSQDAI